MDWDDEYDNGYADTDDALQRDGSMPDKGAEGGLDPLNLADPVSAYFSCATMPRTRSAERKGRT